MIRAMLVAVDMVLVVKVIVVLVVMVTVVPVVRAHPVVVAMANVATVVDKKSCLLHNKNTKGVLLWLPDSIEGAGIYRR